MEKLIKKLGLIIFVIFFLIFVELVILYLKEEVSLFKILEITSVGLVALLYYFIVSSEVKIALRSVREALMSLRRSLRMLREGLRRWK